MGRLLRQRPSPAMIVALAALFVALGGSSYAAIKVGSGNIKRGAVGTRAVANNSIRSADVRNGDLTGRDVKNDSLTNSDIDNAGLRAKSADTAKAADSATTATTATNANALGGITATGFTRPDCTSQSGAVKGFARINASAGFSSTFTTTGVENPYNCSGGTVEARRLGAVGTYEVRFNGASGVLAVVSVLDAGVPTVSSAVNVALVTPGTFRVQGFNTTNGTNLELPFVIAGL